MNNSKISICMATYNGRKYLKEQIDSILTQSYNNWQLLIRDDFSSDNTISIIEDYAAGNPDRIKLIKDNKQHLGASLNFAKLLEHANTEYIMFSDQDDIWLPNKIELTLNAMKKTEQLYPDKPLLVHTDLKIIDSASNTIADSMWSYQKLFPEIGDNLNKIMAHNVVTGCAMMINRKAKEISLPIPKEAIMHDWWIAIKVAAHGKIAYVSTPSILYRQHPGNEIGAKEVKRINSLHFSKEQLLAQCKMLKKADPHTNLWLMVLNKILIKITQYCR